MTPRCRASRSISRRCPVCRVSSVCRQKNIVLPTCSRIRRGAFRIAFFDTGREVGQAFHRPDKVRAALRIVASHERSVVLQVVVHPDRDISDPFCEVNGARGELFVLVPASGACRVHAVRASSGRRRRRQAMGRKQSRRRKSRPLCTSPPPRAKSPSLQSGRSPPCSSTPAMSKQSMSSRSRSMICVSRPRTRAKGSRLHPRT